MKKRVLIICTGNSCRSQMAEGFWRHYAGDRWDVFSAGLTPIGVNPLAIEVMAELGIDIGAHESNSIREYAEQPFDLVITVCSHADRHCPVFPGGGQKLHWPFDDPAGAWRDDERLMQEFRRVRDEIGERVRMWLAREGD